MSQVTGLHRQLHGRPIRVGMGCGYTCWACWLWLCLTCIPALAVGPHGTIFGVVLAVLSAGEERHVAYLLLVVLSTVLTSGCLVDWLLTYGASCADAIHALLSKQPSARCWGVAGKVETVSCWQRVCTVCSLALHIRWAEMLCTDAKMC